MKGKKILSGILGATILCGAAPTAYAVNFNVPNITASKSADDEIIFQTGFDSEQDVSQFTGRGGVETIAAVTDDGHSENTCMKISDRTAGWNGPQLALAGKCEAGTEYLVSAWVKAQWYNSIKISLEYTDSEGERHYNNLNSAVSQGEWVEIPEVKFSFSEDVTNVYIYIEAGDKADIFIDDFVLKKAPVLDIQQDIASLKDVYSPYFKFGTAVTASELASKTRQELIKKHFNSITLGNELKPDAILNQKACQEAGEYDPQISLASARSILNFARDNNIPVRGHVLVWHSQTPDWFFKVGYKDDGEWCDKETMLKRMENYIKNVFTAVKEEYPDVDFYAWDVVNECFTDQGTPRQPGEQGANGSNNSAWVKVFGDNSFIEPAFTFARKYAPEGCKLYYNDFNEYCDGKTKAMVALAEDLSAKGVLDGLGLQSHLDTGFPTAAAYEKALKAFAETGVDIQVTELDITTSDTTENGLKTQADMYSDILDSIMKYSDSISSVVVWGTTDDASWRAAKLPLLFDAEYVAKPAYYSIIDGLDIPATSEPTTAAPTDAPTTAAPTEAPTDAPTDAPTTEAPTAAPTTGTPDTTLWGDADGDGDVTINDAVVVMCYTSNAAAYADSVVNMDAADVYSHGDGISNMDALSIQKYCAEVISELPESYVDDVD